MCINRGDYSGGRAAGQSVEVKEKRKENERTTQHVRCQWDPERTATGAPLQRRAIQLGIKGEMVRRYVEEWCQQIEDITEFVHQTRALVKTRQQPILPNERLLPVSKQVAIRLGMDLQ